MFSGLDLCYADPIQHLITAGEGLSTVDDLSVDDLSVDGLSVNDLSVDGLSADDVSVDDLYDL